MTGLHGIARHRATAWWLLAAWWLAALYSPAHADPAALRLQPGAGARNVWPAVTLLADATHAMTVQDVWNHRDDFAPPAAPDGALGLRKETVWLRLPLAMDQPPRDPWVAALGYGAMQEVDFYLVRDGQVLQHAARGYLRPATRQSLASRTPEMQLDLAGGLRYDLLIRVHTPGPMILPLSISEQPERSRASQRELLLQGLLNGLALCLILYSLVQWRGQREKLFACYALLALGSAGFSLQFFGVGAQFLWPGQIWPERHFALLSGFIALVGSFLFLSQALASDAPRSRYVRGMRAGAALMAAAAVAHALGLLSVQTATAIMSVFGLVPSAASLPRAFRRMRQGDPVGGVLLMGWAVYGLAAGIFAGMAQGLLPANFWTLHSFQIGSTLDMLIFLRVLGLRSEALRLAAHAALVERDTMRSLAHTDALTGLLNRRGMQLTLQSALAQCDAGRPVAVYLLDLDGFKPVNDRYGHDVGDELLVAVARRLGEVAGPARQVARLGGDEFVVLAAGLEHAGQARALGEALLQAFRTPFALRRHRLQVGLTIGYALAPLDGTAATELLALADMAMYRGKQAGKHRLRRCAEPAAEAPQAA